MVVTDHGLIADALRACAMLMRGQVNVFPMSARDEALAWGAEGLGPAS